MIVHGSVRVGKNSSLPADRERRILDRLTRDGQVNATALAEEFSTSEDTIRRDLRELAARGFCQRVYGGAVVISPASTPIAVRVGESNDRKEALGRALAALLRPKQFVYIDAGSTNLAFARVLSNDISLTVATHDPAIAASVMGKAGIKLLLIGGTVNREVGAALGGRAMREVAGMRPDLLVLGVCSIHANEGLGAFDAEDAEMKSTLIQTAGSVAVAVLNEKLESVAAHKVSEIDSIADVVVEADAPPAAMMALSEKGLRLHKAAPPTHREIAITLPIEGLAPPNRQGRLS
jgi:DeoR/GlpR family transcriptional regulator of sugar metabolism